MNVDLKLAADAVEQLNARIKELEGDINIAILQCDAAWNRTAWYARKLSENQDRIFELEIEVARLSTPVWLKIVAWFAR